MYCLKTRILPVLCVLCLCGTNAMAVPSVRVLGANNSGIKAVPAKTGNTGQTVNAGSNIKKASVKTTGVAPKQQNSTVSTERVGTTVGTGRLPVIATKANLQTGYKKVGAISNISSAGTNMDDVSAKLDALQLDLDKKANIVDLDNYYTMEEVDDKIDSIDMGDLSERVTQNESDIDDISERVDGNDGKISIISDQITTINNRIDNIDTISSIQYVQELQNSISGYELQLNQVVASAKKIYDSGTNTFKTVRIVDSFDSSVLTETTD